MRIKFFIGTNRRRCRVCAPGALFPLHSGDDAGVHCGAASKCTTDRQHVRESRCRIRAPIPSRTRARRLWAVRHDNRSPKSLLCTNSRQPCLLPQVLHRQVLHGVLAPFEPCTVVEERLRVGAKRMPPLPLGFVLCACARLLDGENVRVLVRLCIAQGKGGIPPPTPTRSARCHRRRF